MATLHSNLTKLAKQAPGAAQEAFAQTAQDIVSIAKQLSPVDTGALKQSIRADRVDAETIQIGSDMKYAPFVEYGTSNSPAQPYLTPAFAQSKETFKARLKQKLEELA